MTMLRRTLITAFAAIAATLVATGPAVAQRGPFQQFAPPEDEQRRDVPLNVVLRELKMRYGGQHLDARKEGDRYVIAWLTGDGQRLTIEVDARSGRTISVRK